MGWQVFGHTVSKTCEDWADKWIWIYLYFNFKFCSIRKKKQKRIIKRKYYTSGYEFHLREEQRYKNRKHEGCTYFVAWGDIDKDHRVGYY